MNKNDLKLDWCSYKAAKYACEHWHYSKCMPVGKTVKVGVWENNKFIGVVIFSRGANHNLGKSFKLNQDQICELTRVALTEHRSQVSRILSIAIKQLKKQSKGIKLIVSYSDTEQGHHGGIYQAGNWVYDMSSFSTSTIINGKRMHNKSVYSKYGFNELKKLKEVGINAHYIKDGAKHRFLMPLDKEIRGKIQHLAKPYPKRIPVEEQQKPFAVGSSTLTDTLQTKEATNE